MKRSIRWMVATIALFTVVSAEAAGFKVVVNEQCAVSSLPAEEVSLMFLKRSLHWSDGTPVVPVDQARMDGARDSMSRKVHGRAAVAIKSYWQQQIFAGRGVPPVELGSDEQVIAYVKANRGAIGYVSNTTATAGVKVLNLD